MGAWMFILEKQVVAAALIFNFQKTGKKYLTWNQIWSYGRTLYHYLEKKFPNNQVRLQMGNEEMEEMLREYPELFTTVDDIIAMKDGVTDEILSKRILAFTSFDIFMAMHEEECINALYQ